uniref:PPi-type phosphoenolpyruvate carboxykinase lobe 2 domain-containing protein n=1 Tax=Eutreptiella gymnastica TaxID=73025 RepID=A0A7S4CIY2_9EUGL
MLSIFKHQEYLLRHQLSPADQRIQAFLDDAFKGLDLGGAVPSIPSNSLTLDHFGMARLLSLPRDGDKFENELLSSYRLRNGVLHNPISDRRTTAGSFHVALGGLPVAGDKKEVPLHTFGHLLWHAVHSCPADSLQLPFMGDTPAQTWVSLLLRPMAIPEVPGYSPVQRMENRLFVPGSLVCNLDFVENIFGNWGDPRFPINDAALDVESWTGTTGCIILAPHIKGLTKKAVGLPHISKATDRQKRDRMCWEKEDELYNDGTAFKICHRTKEGVMVTILADNYFGYCKKEVKTQLTYTTNLIGLSEEEHAGGALAFYQVRLGSTLRMHDSRLRKSENKFSDMMKLLGNHVELKPEGYAVDKRFPEIIYLPETMSASLGERKVKWVGAKGEEKSLKMLTKHFYMHPSGYSIHLEKHAVSGTYTLVGLDPRATFCHKPCTVSGGGKSEISKSMEYAMKTCNVFVGDFANDKKKLQEIFDKISKRLGEDVFSNNVTLGTVIYLCCPGDEWDAAWNKWLSGIEDRIWTIAFAIKRHYKASWGKDWQSHFHVDVVNGTQGNELLIDSAGRDRRKLLSRFLRMGLDTEGAWRTFTLRQDFQAAFKVQMEDDISASTVVPSKRLSGYQKDGGSKKILQNCEMRLFQRPDDAIHRGFDVQTEDDMSRNGLFSSNFDPLVQADVDDEIEDPFALESYTEPMQEHLRKGTGNATYLVSSALTRKVGEGKRTTNPRYLQLRPDVHAPMDTHLAAISIRLHRRVPVTDKLVVPVDMVLPGRRNNPPMPGIRMLAVYGPLHYQELPELFMDFTSSLTGKSPSTTGAGSEGALTKGPFNALCTTSDLNNTLVSLLLTGHAGFTSAAGFIGPKYDVGHDITVIVPEIFCRLEDHERDPQWLISQGYLEPVKDFEHKGRKIPANLLGYRITTKFTHNFMGKLFTNPGIIFPDDMLRPELQDMDAFVDGIDNLTEAHAKTAKRYFEDGSIKDACPPLQALLHIMAYGQWEGKGIQHPDVRKLFTRESMLGSEWYRKRLIIQQKRTVKRWQRHIAYLDSKLKQDSNGSPVDLNSKLEKAKAQLAFVEAPAYLQHLEGTIGADPIHGEE